MRSSACPEPDVTRMSSVVLTSRNTLQVFRRETRAFQYRRAAHNPDCKWRWSVPAGAIREPLPRLTLRQVYSPGHCAPPNKIVFGETGAFWLRYRQSLSKPGF